VSDWGTILATTTGGWAPSGPAQDTTPPVTVAAPADHSGDGTHTVAYRSVDAAGNTEQAKSLTVKVDTTGPITKAKLTYARVNHAVRLPYKATDNLSPQVTSVAVVVKNARGLTVATITVSAPKNVNTWYSVTWTPRARGAYRYCVYAKDLAGNAQSVRGWAKVIVR